jgi:hypothetical protein
VKQDVKQDVKERCENKDVKARCEYLSETKTWKNEVKQKTMKKKNKNF